MNAVFLIAALFNVAAGIMYLTRQRNKKGAIYSFILAAVILIIGLIEAVDCIKAEKRA